MSKLIYCIVALFYFVVVKLCAAKPQPITQQLFVKKNFNNLVLQEDEIIKFSVKDYISGSFLNFKGNMRNIETNKTLELDGSLIKLSKPHEEYAALKFTCEDVSYKSSFWSLSVIVPIL